MESPQGMSRLEWVLVTGVFALTLFGTGIATSAARERARDFKRLADMARLQSALELHFNNTNAYPSTTGEIELGGAAARCLGANGFQPACPKDQAIFLQNVPAQTRIGLGSAFALYAYQGNEQAYVIRLSLERGWPELGIAKGGTLCLRSGKAPVLSPTGQCTL